MTPVIVGGATPDNEKGEFDGTFYVNNVASPKIKGLGRTEYIPLPDDKYKPTDEKITVKWVGTKPERVGLEGDCVFINDKSYCLKKPHDVIGKDPKELEMRKSDDL